MTRSTRTSAPVAMVTVALVLFVALAGVRAQSGDTDKKIKSQQSELDRIKKDIKTHRAQAKKLGRQERAVMSKLKDLDKELDLSRQLLRELQEHEEFLVANVDSLRGEIAFNEVLLERQRAQLATRLRQMYKRDPSYRWDIILGSATIDEALARYKFMKILAEQDADMVAGVRDRTLQMQTQSASVTESLAEIAMARGEREDEGSKLAAGKRERSNMLKNIRSQKSQHTAAIKDLEAAQKQVKDLLGRLEKKRLEDQANKALQGGNFAALKGRMVWPVTGKLARRFGKQTHPKYGTVTFNNGIDIAAPPGTPIQAVAPGVVEFVDWIDAYGKCVILNHGGGYYTLYAHVAATFVKQEQKVSAGDVIAEVGDTGSLEGFECHFEIRQSKQALNPLKWLSPRKRSSS